MSQMKSAGGRTAWHAAGAPSRPTPRLLHPLLKASAAAGVDYQSHVCLVVPIPNATVAATGSCPPLNCATRCRSSCGRPA